MLERLEGLGVLAEIHCGLRWTNDAQLRLDRLNSSRSVAGCNLQVSGEITNQAAMSYLAWLMDNDPQKAKELAVMLQFPGDLQAALIDITQLKPELNGFSEALPSEVVARLKRCHVLALCTLVQSLPESESMPIQKYLAHWKYVRPVTDGNVLRKMGVSQGPAYSKILLALQTAWLDGLVASPAQEKEYLSMLLAKENGKD
jgi:hypothetical protein